MSRNSERDQRVAEFLAAVNQRMFTWQQAMELRDFRGAAEIAIEAVKTNWSTEFSAVEAGFRPTHISHRILLNALRDLANLKLIVDRPDWIEYPNAIEAAWMLAHNAKERLSGHSGVNDEFIHHCLQHVIDVLKVVNDRFGVGIYNSWEVTFETPRCTICGMDIRGCDHVPGQWYGQDQCDCSLDGKMTCQAVDIVSNPRDPRCRLWPWMKKENPDNGTIVFERVPIYIIFDLEGESDGGHVVDATVLFPAK